MSPLVVNNQKIRRNKSGEYNLADLHNLARCKKPFGSHQCNMYILPQPTNEKWLPQSNYTALYSDLDAALAYVAWVDPSLEVDFLREINQVFKGRLHRLSIYDFHESRREKTPKPTQRLPVRAWAALLSLTEKNAVRFLIADKYIHRLADGRFRIDEDHLFFLDWSCAPKSVLNITQKGQEVLTPIMATWKKESTKCWLNLFQSGKLKRKKSPHIVDSTAFP